MHDGPMKTFAGRGLILDGCRCETTGSFSAVCRIRRADDVRPGDVQARIVATVDGLMRSGKLAELSRTRFNVSAFVMTSSHWQFVQANCAGSSSRRGHTVH
jgi:hypothetical protein